MCHSTIVFGYRTPTRVSERLAEVGRMLPGGEYYYVGLLIGMAALAGVILELIKPDFNHGKSKIAFDIIVKLSVRIRTARIPHPCTIGHKIE